MNVDLWGNRLVTYSTVDKKVHSLVVDGIENPSLFFPINGTVDKYLVSSNGTGYIMQWDGESETAQILGTAFDMSPGHVDSGYIGPQGKLYVGDFGVDYCLDRSDYGLYGYSSSGSLTKYADGFTTTVGGVVVEATNTFYHLGGCEKELIAFDWDPISGALCKF